MKQKKQCSTFLNRMEPVYRKLCMVPVGFSKWNGPSHMLRNCQNTRLVVIYPKCTPFYKAASHNSAA